MAAATFSIVARPPACPLSTRKNLFASWPDRHRLFFPVVHVVDPEAGSPEATVTEHVVHQVGIALKCGADGVFLCPAMVYSDSVLLALHAAVCKAHPGVFVGLNLLGCSRPFALSLAGVPALWSDKGVDFKGVSPIMRAAASARNRQWAGFHFAGWLFKGQSRTLPEGTTSAQEAAALAKAVEDLNASAAPGTVVCTSGAGTGQALGAELMQKYREALGPDWVVAVASGVTVDNVEGLLPHADVFLVASGIEQTPSSLSPEQAAFFEGSGLSPLRVGYLDEGKVTALADAIHAWHPSGPANIVDAE